jgi:hypothetical protein
VTSQRKRPARDDRPLRNHTDAAESSAYVRQLRARRLASWRLPVLESCGRRSDPWWCPEPGERGYEDAARHLLDHGLTPAPNRLALQAMWRAGGESRRVAQVIAQR